MKDLDILKDILQYKIASELYYNESIIKIRNPEARKLFTQMRDDEMRTLAKLQQKVERLEATPRIISRIFPSRAKY